MNNSEKHIILRDFSIAEPQSAWSMDRQPGKWQLKSYHLANGDTGRALWVQERIKLGEPPYPLPGEVTVDPKLCGWHAVYVLVHRPKWFGGIDVRLSDRPWTFINPMEREVYRPNPKKREEITAGKNDIEIEVFYCLARMDGQKIHLRYPNGKQSVDFPAERGQASITGLRFRPVDDAEVREYFEDQKNLDHKRIIINFETYNGMIPVLEQRIAAWAESDVWAIHMEIASGSGGMMYSGSRYEQAWGENISEKILPALKPWVRDSLIPLRTLLAKGKTPFDIAVPPARKAGIRVIGCLRMDLFWGGSDDPADWKPGTCDDYPFLFNGRFYREHPELRIPGGHNLDYYYPQVRNHFADLLCEAAERIDLDGINMDFTRWPPFIRSDADPGIMVEFIRDMRRRLDDIGRQKGRRLSLSADVVDGHYCGLTLTQQRIDLEAWLKTRCLDYVAVERTNELYRPVPGDHPIEYYIDLGRRLGTPVYPRQDQVIEGMDPPCAMIFGYSELDSDPLIGDELLDYPKIQPYCGPEHYEKRILQFYQMGAQRVMLANRWDGWLTLRRLGHQKELEDRTKTGKAYGVREGNPIEF